MEWTWDPIERLASERHAFVPTGNNLLATFAYNPASQIVTRSRNNDAYVWTGANRLDAYTVNGLNQYVSVNNVNFTHDANGNLTTQPAPAEAGGTRTYTYDIENRLVSSASAGQTITLRYDPLGRLWEVAAPSGTTRFLWDGDALVSEYDGNNQFLRRYAHGSSAGDDPITWTETGGVTRYLHADHQGSIIAIAGQSGANYAINRYDEWGAPAVGNQGRFGYTGQIWLPEIGLWHYKNRMYAPWLGRFMQTDPVGYEGGINLYAYVMNDPVNLTDPTGLAQDDVGRAAQTLRSLRRSIQREISAADTPAVGSRLLASSDRARVEGLRTQLRALSSLTPEALAGMRVNSPDAAVGAGLTDAMRASPPETIYTATASNGGVTFDPASQSSRTSDSAQASVGRESLLAIGHEHFPGGGRQYPGIGDPGAVLIFRVPNVYAVGGNSNSLGWNGSRFTLSNLRGSVPDYNSAPSWIRDIFEPW